MSQIPPVSLPNRVSKGDEITATWANSIRDAISRIIRGHNETSSPTPVSLEPPFWVRFFINADETGYYATITRGVVAEFDTDGGVGVDAIIYHELDELLPDVNGDRPEFAPITDGQAVYVLYETDDKGKVKTTLGGKPQIVIGADGLDSTHYDPPVGDETAGDGGTFYRKLAVMDIVDGIPRCTPFEMGGNIRHWRQLPLFKKAGGDYDIFKQFDIAAGRYETKGITGETRADTGLKTIDYKDDADDLKAYTVGIHAKIDCYGTNGFVMHFRDGLLVQIDGTTPSGTTADHTILMN